MAYRLSFSFMILSLLLLVFGLIPQHIHAEETTEPIVRTIIFPVIGDVHYTDDFGAPRSGGRIHEGNDLVGEKMMPLVAAVDGTLQYVPYPEPSWGFMVSIKDAEGYEYNYVHMNNDTPGTDDGLGGGRYAYAPGIIQGVKVIKGQLIGWMGDSGNAEGTSAHLHFEMRQPDGTAFSPYTSLQQAKKITRAKRAPAGANEILPYGTFKGGASLTVGNFDTDAKQELATGAGRGTTPKVKLFEAKGKLKTMFLAYDEGFTGGLDITSGDVNGDGIDEIITAAGAGGAPHIRVFDTTGKLLSQFYAYEETFRGGVFVTTADIDQNGKDEIITGPGKGRVPMVRIFKMKGKLVDEFLAYKERMQSGVDVAAVDATPTTAARIVTGAGISNTPRVRVFEPNGTRLTGFLAYDEDFRGGVRVDVNAQEILTAPASEGSPEFRVFLFSGEQQRSSTTFEPWWIGGYDVALGSQSIFIVSSGGRRVSVRQLE